MYNYSKDGITIASILDTRKENKEKKFPVKIRVTYKRVRKHFPTGKTLTNKEWEDLAKSKNKDLKEIRESIENSFSLVRQNVIALAEKGGFSFDALNLRMSKGNIDTLNNAFKNKIQKLTEEERIGSRDISMNTLRAIEKFAGKNINYESINIEWLKRFEKHMLIDKAHSTVGIYMRDLRTILNEAKKAGIIKETQYPFGNDKFKIQNSQGTKKALTLLQLGEVFRFQDGNESTDFYKNIWFFIYYSNGINVADLIKLKFKNIKENEICFIRQKTEKTMKTRREIKIPIKENLQEIIDKWGNEKKSENYIFPFLTGKENAEERKKITKSVTKSINARMKKIGNHLGFGDITTYTARHTFATVLKRGGAKIAFISESLGHNDLKTTESYLDSFEKEERFENADLLSKF